MNVNHEKCTLSMRRYASGTVDERATTRASAPGTAPTTTRIAATTALKEVVSVNYWLFLSSLWASAALRVTLALRPLVTHLPYPS